MNTLKIAPLIIICIAVFLVSLFPMASIAEEDEIPCIKWVLVGEPAVNPNNELTEYRGGGTTPGWYTSAAYDGKFNLYEVSETRFYEHEREWYRGLSWDVKFNCDFDAPPRELFPGESYDLTATFTHEVVEFTEGPRAYQQFSYQTGAPGIRLVLPERMYAGNQFLYSPWHQDFTGENSKTWTLDIIEKGAPFYPAPGATWTLTAESGGIACCNVTWTYEAQEIPCDIAKSTSTPSPTPGSPTSTPQPSACDIVGEWQWFSGSTVYVYSDGTFESRVNGEKQYTGTWRATGSMTYELTWSHGYTDSLTISVDCQRLDGKNQNGTTVWGTRTSGDAPTPMDTPIPTPTVFRDPLLGACEWTGTWDTSWGMMELVQTGNQVTGTYGYQDGRITGTVNGNMLTGTWSEAPSHSPPNDAGDFEFTMSSDCNSFKGRWRYDSTGNWDTGWTGTRVGEPTSIPQPTTCDIVGEWKWFSGTTVRIYDGGAFTEYRGSGTTGLTGTWRATGNMTYELVWSHGYTDNLTISADCQRLDGKNQEGTTVWGTRTSGEVPPPTGSPTPTTGIPTSSPTYTTSEVPPSLVVDSRTVVPGGTVTVPVRLVNVRDVGSLNFDITYDSSVINITRVDKGSLLSGISFVVNPNETGIIQFGFATEDGVNGTGPIGQIVCNAVGSAGSSTPLTISAIEATDSAGNPITLQTFSGSVTIDSDRTIGDSNGDGILTELDALAALRMSVNLMEENLVLDMDQDGRVTAKDALAILSIAVRGR